MSQEAKGIYWMVSIVSETLLPIPDGVGGRRVRPPNSGCEYILHTILTAAIVTKSSFFGGKAK